jgi:phage tail-like protein
MPLTPAPEPTALQLRGLAVTEDHYLVVGVLQPPGLLLFDLYAGGPPRQLLWPDDVEFTPFDMAPRPGGGVWILDRDLLQPLKPAHYWALDRHFNVIRRDALEVTLVEAVDDDFQPLAGGAPRRTPRLTFPGGISLDAAFPLAPRDAIAIEALPDGTVLILDRQPDPRKLFSSICHYAFGRQLGAPVSTDAIRGVIEPESAAEFTLLAHDFAFVPEHAEPEGTVPDRLYVVEEHGNQTFAFTIAQTGEQLTLEPVEEYLPMRLFGGKGLVTAGTLPYYDFGDGWIPLIRQRRPRFVGEGTLLTSLLPPFDGNDPECFWHRVLLDACLPPDTTVEVWSRAANDAGALAIAPWQREPDFYRRGDGSEQPFAATSGEGYGTWELLVQRARGRYAQLKLTLRGNERTTPRLRALRLYYPRFSYLQHYLPGVYREDVTSASFLDRFLANIEGFYTTLEDKIAAVQILFDLRSAPSEALAWLASWFDLALDPSWDDRRRRLLLAHAPEFFRYRGTPRGLLMALRLTLEECPDESIFAQRPARPARASGIRIIEKYRTRHTPGVVLGDPTEAVGPRIFTPGVRWRPTQGGAELHRRYAEFLNQGPLSFPITPPQEAAAATRWKQFARDVVGFVPAATGAEEERWQHFLARRYPDIERLKAAYGTSQTQQWQSFTDVPWPTALPPDGAPLQDWYQFEGTVLVMLNAAHRFSVLLPLPQSIPPGSDARLRNLDLARRMVHLEKPAHTIFDIKFFWELFRVGEARLGEDTLIDRGSRAPALMPSLVLGQGYLAEAFLTPGPPQDTTERYIVGRDPLGRSAILEERRRRDHD